MYMHFELWFGTLQLEANVFLLLAISTIRLSQQTPHTFLQCSATDTLQ